MYSTSVDVESLLRSFADGDTMSDTHEACISKLDKALLNYLHFGLSLDLLPTLNSLMKANPVTAYKDRYLKIPPNIAGVDPLRDWLWYRFSLQGKNIT